MVVHRFVRGNVVKDGAEMQQIDAVTVNAA